MKKEQIIELFEKFENSGYIYNNVECWSARELQEILAYSKWDNFKRTIEKAKSSCENSGESIENHFADFGKMVDLGSGAQSQIIDIGFPHITYPK